MHINTYGLEKEFFIKKDNAFILTPAALPHDACGYLAEARGEPHADPVAARHLLAASTEKLNRTAQGMGIELVDTHTADVPADLRRVALRTYGKGASRAYFARGGVGYRSNKPRAGLHIHFGSRTEIRDEKGSITRAYASIVNMPRIIYMLDTAFAQEIKESRRVAGEYEMKDWGFEYRSLPSTVDLDKVVAVLQQIAVD